MSENRRVVVTGIGAITPLGNNVADTWAGMKNGKNGIAPITLFDTEKFKAKLAAEVKGFDPKEYLEVNEVLRTDRYAQFAVAAAQQARRRGVGKALIGELLRQAKERGICRIILEVRVSNTPAIRLYEGMQFYKVGTRKGFYDFPKEDAGIMVWEKTRIGS